MFYVRSKFENIEKYHLGSFQINNPWFNIFTVQVSNKYRMVLDLLFKIKNNYYSSLTFMPL